MRSQSSRFFIILLHLVGVSTNLPSVGSQPSLAILLERINLSHYPRGLTGLLEEAAKWNEHDLVLSEPFWLQDDVDGKCLGPHGTLSECGDATLWLIRQRPVTETNGNGGFWKWLLGSMDDIAQQLHTDNEGDEAKKKEWGLALQFVERDTSGQVIRLEYEEECLIPSRRQRRKVNSSLQLPSNAVGYRLASCRRSLDSKVWSWKIDSSGLLYRQTVTGTTTTTTARRQQQQCFWRRGTTAFLHSCSLSKINHDRQKYENSHNDDVPRKIRFTLVRCQSPSTASRLLLHQRQQQSSSQTTNAIKTPSPSLHPLQEQEEEEEEEVQEQETNDNHATKPGHIRDLAHSHATDPLKHPTLLKQGRTSLWSSSSVASSSSSSTSTTTGRRQVFRTLQDTNPILLLGPAAVDQQQQQQNQHAHALRPSKQDDSTILSPPIHDSSSSAYKLMRLQTHPYLATAKNELWTDTTTGLEFPTDLCRYLGHDRNQVGRHTMTGVGYYTKTILAIKVYGVALYVSKRHVLADPVMETFAHLDAQQLRERPDFYAHLRQMPSSFDRTLFLKLNMQLSTESIRSSLQASWKLLTPERKELLISSSMKPRPAHQDMLDTILRPDNPGRCSCGQLAPPEYKADNSCCARGTELVFTWRTNGNLEIRVDGRIMDTFARPDIAKGIFYEYLRTDDPIAPDFRERVVDGFPFLLGPLAQVRGVSHQMHKQEQRQLQQQQQQRHQHGGGGALGRALAHHLTNALQAGANGAATNVANAARALEKAGRTVGYEIERRRDVLWHQLTTSLPEQGKKFMQKRRKRPDALATSVAEWMKRQTRRQQQSSMQQEQLQDAHENENESLKKGTKPTLMQKMCFTMVHLYLLLLLIVSFPGSHYIKLVRRRSHHTNCHDDDDDDDEASTESSSTEMEPQSPRRNPTELHPRMDCNTSDNLIAIAMHGERNFWK